MLGGQQEHRPRLQGRGEEREGHVRSAQEQGGEMEF